MTTMMMMTKSAKSDLSVRWANLFGPVSLSVSVLGGALKIATFSWMAWFILIKAPAWLHS